MRNKIKHENQSSILFILSEFCEKEYFAIVLHSSAIFEGRYNISVTFVAKNSGAGESERRCDFSIFRGASEMRKVLRRATKNYSAEDLPFSLTKLSFSLARF